MSDLKAAIYEKIKDHQLAVLATVTEDGKPWARYVVPFADENLNLWFATFAGSRKITQIEKNPEVHLTMGATDVHTFEHYFQIQGRAEILNEETIRQNVWNDGLKAYFSGPDDPNYRVVKITPYRIEMQGKDPVPPDVWEA